MESILVGSKDIVPIIFLKFQKEWYFNSYPEMRIREIYDHQGKGNNSQ